MGIVAFTVLVAGKLWLKNRPVAFLVVVAGMLAARSLNLETQGVALLGQVPQGLPAFGLPDVSRRELNELLPVALASFVLGAVETSAIGRMFAQKHGYRFDANQELLALGAGNLLAGLGRGFPVSGGMSQSLVNESAGARTPVSGLVAAVFTLIVVLFSLPDCSGTCRNRCSRPSSSPQSSASLTCTRCGRSGSSAAGSSSWRSRRSSECWDQACCWAPECRSFCCSGRPPGLGY